MPDRRRNAAIRRRNRLAWSLFILSTALLLINIGLCVLSASLAHPTSLLGWEDRLIDVASFIPIPVIGVLIARRRPEHPVGWMLLVGTVVSTPDMLTRDYAVLAVLSSSPLPGRTLAVGMHVWTTPVAYLCAAGVFLLFPSGRLPSERWRRWRPVLVVLAGCLIMASGLRPGPPRGLPLLDNPSGVGGAVGSLITVSVDVLYAVLVAVTLAAVASIVLRFRRSRGPDRVQFKWAGAAGAGIAAYYGAETILPTISQRGWSLLEPLAWTVFWAALAVAILQHRLYDIDHVVSRTVSYGLLTATLVVAYNGVVVVLGPGLSRITGSGTLPVMIATLVAAACFHPARTRIQRAVDKRFNRRRHDAHRTLDEFRHRVNREVDLQRLCAELVAVMRDTVEPASVSLWMAAPESGPRMGRRR